MVVCQLKHWTANSTLPRARTEYEKTHTKQTCLLVIVHEVANIKNETEMSKNMVWYEYCFL